MQALIAILIMSLGVLNGCRSLDLLRSKPAPTKIEDSNLTREEAQSRAQRIKQVHYDLEVNLNESGPYFSGTQRIEFNLHDASKPLRLDFYEGKITSLLVNAQEVGIEAKRQYWIEIPANVLLEGANTIVVSYSAAYSRQGQGLHFFTDPETREPFLYSQFETFDANRFMPCFDQPDLRATLDLKVDAPATWQVISTTTETDIKKNQNGRALWTFARTAPLATYLFSLHAGPYKVWTDQYKSIPLRLLARPSMAKYVRVEEWFKVTKQGLRFFESYFDYPYPFKKYDQVFAPEFNAGAMENVASVTFSEHFLVRGEPTRQQRRSAASVLLHEMAHMWFGDIVTMKWWNDLWLNESFATYMASLGLAEATEFKEAWQEFRVDDKTWAYWEDSLPTTHPIEAPIPTVKDAFANFDGITYGKGAAVMKQLSYHITEKSFQKGVQEYFRKHAFQNTELKDFIAALQNHTSVPLADWADAWLKQKGVDQIAAEWTCEGRKLKTVKLVTTQPDQTRFRPQTLSLLLLSSARDKNPKTYKVSLTSPNQDVKLNIPCPKFIYPNAGDFAYLRIKLDPTSLAFAKRHLSELKDPLLRAMLWDDFWNMVRNTQLPLKDYATLVRDHFAREQDPLILEKIVGTLGGRNEKVSMLFYWPNTEEAKQSKLAFINQLEKQYLERMKKSKPGSDEQKLWLDSYIQLARTEEGLSQLSTWAKQEYVLPKLKIDIDRRWAMVKQLQRFKHAEAESRFGDIRKMDPSDRGQKYALAIEAIQPDPAVKRKWFDQLKTRAPELGYAGTVGVLSAMFPTEQRQMSKMFEDEYYEYLDTNRLAEEEIFVNAMAAGLDPLNCSETESKRMAEFIKSRKFSPNLFKTLKVELEEDERCQRIRAFSQL